MVWNRRSFVRQESGAWGAVNWLDWMGFVVEYYWLMGEIESRAVFVMAPEKPGIRVLHTDD